MKIEEAVVVDNDILGGTPVFKGTRVPVKNLFDYLKAGDSLNDFLKDFDYIPKEHCIVILEAAELLVTETDKLHTKAKSGDFRGKLNLTEEQYQDFQNHLKNIRNEWEQDI